MPRAERTEYPVAHSHAMCRGINGKEMFLSDEGRLAFFI
jgi:hypothetical protein